MPSSASQESATALPLSCNQFRAQPPGRGERYGANANRRKMWRATIAVLVIARYFILLPFDLLVTEDSQWPALEFTSTEYQIRVHPPKRNHHTARSPAARNRELCPELNPVSVFGAS